jgi:hypothetical protein
MIGHEHLGMDPHRLRCRSLDQHAEERPIIGVVEEDRGPVDTEAYAPDVGVSVAWPNVRRLHQALRV